MFTHVNTCSLMSTHVDIYSLMYTRVHSCPHMYTYIHSCPHAGTHMFTHVHTCTQVFIHVHTCTHVFIHVHTCTHMFTPVHTCSHMHTRIHLCSHMSTYSHMSTPVHPHQSVSKSQLIFFFFIFRRFVSQSVIVCHLLKKQFGKSGRRKDLERMSSDQRNILDRGDAVERVCSWNVRNVFSPDIEAEVTGSIWRLTSWNSDNNSVAAWKRSNRDSADDRLEATWRQPQVQTGRVWSVLQCNVTSSLTSGSLKELANTMKYALPVSDHSSGKQMYWEAIVFVGYRVRSRLRKHRPVYKNRTEIPNLQDLNFSFKT